jgi:hypothetical protein
MYATIITLQALGDAAPVVKLVLNIILLCLLFGMGLWGIFISYFFIKITFNIIFGVLAFLWGVFDVLIPDF